MFERIEDPTNSWRDFSTLTPMEGIISEIELKIMKWASKPDEPHKFQFEYDHESYLMQYFPKDKNTEDLFKTNISSASISDEIRLLFGIESAFLMITSPNSVSPDGARQLLSIISASESMTVPFFIQISAPEFSSYIGRFSDDTQQTSYSSSMEDVTKEFKSLVDIILLFKSSFANRMTKISFSARMIYTILSDDEDQKLSIIFLWPKAELLKTVTRQLDFHLAPHIVLSLQPLDQIPINDLLHDSIGEARSHSPRWKTSDLISDKPDWLNECAPKDTHLPIKAAPLNSIISVLSQRILEPNIDALWIEFIKYIRVCFDQKKLIEGIEGSEVETQHSLLYQKLQMLNFNISKIVNNTTNIYMSEDCYEEIRKYIYHSIPSPQDNSTLADITSDILCFISIHGKDSLDHFLGQSSYDKELITAVWKAIPAYTSDPTILCEMALDYIESLTPFDVLSLLIMMQISEILHSLNDRIPTWCRSLRENLMEIVENVLKLQYNDEFYDRADLICQSISFLEYQINKLELLLGNFPYCKNLVEQLVIDHFATIKEKQERDSILDLVEETTEMIGGISHIIQVIVTGTMTTDEGNVDERLFISKIQEKVLIATATQESFG